jgi:hypothetical protein
LSNKLTLFKRLVGYLLISQIIMMKKQMNVALKLMCLGLALATISRVGYAQVNVAPVAKPVDAFKSGIKLDNIDGNVYAEYVDGKEQKITARDEKSALPQWVVLTDKTMPGYTGVYFGVSKKATLRHLRIGFINTIPVGSLVVYGGGRPSVLKVDATYPGNLSDESQWMPAQRLVNGQISSAEVGNDEYAIWVLPAGTKTRAIRFSHQPEANDLKYEGFLGGLLVSGDRFINIADEATASSKSNNQNAQKLNNGLSDGFSTWENQDVRSLPVAGQAVVSQQNPEWVLLTWPQPVKINALVTLSSGFSTASVQIYIGPVDKHPRDAKESQWQNMADYTGVNLGWPAIAPNMLNLGKTITTRAVRLKMTAPIKEAGNLVGKSHSGQRIWLGELWALQYLGNLPLQPAAIQVAQDKTANPPIAIPFTLKDAGYVTLVIENKDGVRVRNLISETYFKAGKNIAWWDGTDDLGRDVDAAKHGLYKIPARFVEPGQYHVRGLVRGEIKPTYEFSVYAPGSPPWPTDDHTGGWLANHSAPMSALFVNGKQSPTGQPAVYLGCYVTEGPDGMAWVDLDGNKLGGKRWVGGNWTAAPYLAKDAGELAETGVYAYVGSVWETDKQSGEDELRITAITPTADKNIIKYVIGARDKNTNIATEIGGMSIHNGLAVVSLTQRNKLIFIDIKTGKVLGTTPLNAPEGSVFTTKGDLLLLTGKKLLRYSGIKGADDIPAPQTLISTDLEAPVGITLDDAGNIYISDGGSSHQVKVFTPGGKLIRKIGVAGTPKTGPYDDLHMNNPAGMAIDSKQQLWVTENDFLPKRVSVWSLDGKFIKAFYGPGKYGGGGELDANDKTSFYYGEESRGAMEFKIDWQTGQSKLADVYYRPQPSDIELGFRGAGPETALYHDGKRYWTNCYNSSPTSGHTTAFLFADRDGVAKPIAAMGRAIDWDVLKGESFKSRWPEGVDLSVKGPKADAFFIWTDQNNDAHVQPNEVSFLKGPANGITVLNDLSFCISQLNGNVMRFTPSKFNNIGNPQYDIDHGEILAKGAQGSASSGGNQTLTTTEGWTIGTYGILPFDKFSISGAKNGVAKWSYPDLWPGLHASHEAPRPDRAGELIGTTRLLGGLMDNKGSDSGPLWAVNSNHGMVYIFTSDGLFVATVFEAMRDGKRWSMPAAERGMSLKGLTLSEENFWPTITQTADGSVYMVDGGRSSVVKIDGLKDIHRLPDMDVTVTKSDMDKSRDYLVQIESMRQRTQGKGILKVDMNAKPITVDGKMDDWTGADWVDIDKSGVRANFNANSKPYDITASVALNGDRLYVAYRTGENDLLVNSGEMPIALFKTGGALDLMIGADETASPDRLKPVVGDSRLLVTLVKGKPKALLYKGVVNGTKPNDKVPFSSPWRTITFDKVEDVTSQLQFAKANGNFEISLPLAVFGLKPKAGMTIKGDVGILRGDGVQTSARSYWSNKATGIVSDVPAEAELTPALWGTFEFEQGLQ